MNRFEIKSHEDFKSQESNILFVLKNHIINRLKKNGKASFVNESDDSYEVTISFYTVDLLIAIKDNMELEDFLNRLITHFDRKLESVKTVEIENINIERVEVNDLAGDRYDMTFKIRKGS